MLSPPVSPSMSIPSEFRSDPGQSGSYDIGIKSLDRPTYREDTLHTTEDNFVGVQSNRTSPSTQSSNLETGFPEQTLRDQDVTTLPFESAPDPLRRTRASTQEIEEGGLQDVVDDYLCDEDQQSQLSSDSVRLLDQEVDGGLQGFSNVRKRIREEDSHPSRCSGPGPRSFYQCAPPAAGYFGFTVDAGNSLGLGGWSQLAQRYHNDMYRLQQEVRQPPESTVRRLPTSSPAAAVPPGPLIDATSRTAPKIESSGASAVQQKIAIQNIRPALHVPAQSADYRHLPKSEVISSSAGHQQSAGLHRRFSDLGISVSPRHPWSDREKITGPLFAWRVLIEDRVTITRSRTVRSGLDKLWTPWSKDAEALQVPLPSDKYREVEQWMSSILPITLCLEKTFSTTDESKTPQQTWTCPIRSTCVSEYSSSSESSLPSLPSSPTLSTHSQAVSLDSVASAQPLDGDYSSDCNLGIQLAKDAVATPFRRRRNAHSNLPPLDRDTLADGERLNLAKMSSFQSRTSSPDSTPIATEPSKGRMQAGRSQSPRQVCPFQRPISARGLRVVSLAGPGVTQEDRSIWDDDSDDASSGPSSPTESVHANIMRKSSRIVSNPVVPIRGMLRSLSMSARSPPPLLPIPSDQHPNVDRPYVRSTTYSVPHLFGGRRDKWTQPARISQQERRGSHCDVGLGICLGDTDDAFDEHWPNRDENDTDDSIVGESALPEPSQPRKLKKIRQASTPRAVSSSCASTSFDLSTPMPGARAKRDALDKQKARHSHGVAPPLPVTCQKQMRAWSMIGISSKFLNFKDEVEIHRQTCTYNVPCKVCRRFLSRAEEFDRGFAKAECAHDSEE